MIKCPLCEGGEYRCAHCNNARLGELDHICPACPGSFGLHDCNLCKGKGYYDPIDYDEGSFLRDVDLYGFRLTTWQSANFRTDRNYVYYRFNDKNGKVLFEGDDYSPGMATSIDGDESLRGLIGFLTLRPGDTDDEYFNAYTRDQWDFAQTEAEELSIWAMEPEHLPGCDDDNDGKCEEGCSSREWAFENWNKNGDGTTNEEDQKPNIPPDSNS